MSNHEAIAAQLRRLATQVEGEHFPIGNLEGIAVVFKGGFDELDCLTFTYGLTSLDAYRAVQRDFDRALLAAVLSDGKSISLTQQYHELRATAQREKAKQIAEEVSQFLAHGHRCGECNRGFKTVRGLRQHEAAHRRQKGRRTA